MTIQDPNSFKNQNKPSLYSSFYFFSMGNLKEVSILHTLGKSSQFNNAFQKKKKIYIYSHSWL